MTTQTILITGATSGIGRHAALYLLNRGHRVIATGRRTDALVALETEANNPRLATVRMDVTDADSIAEAVAFVEGWTQGRGVDVLINNAGYGLGGAVLDVTDAEIKAQFDTNVFGLIAVSRAFAHKMMARGSGRILNVSSVGGRTTLPLLGVYNATKYAVESLSDAMRMELAPFGVQVVVIEPGGINTNFNAVVTETLHHEVEAPTGPWAGAVSAAPELIQRFERFSPDPTPISRAFTSAIESRSPRSRYVAPFTDAVMLTLAEWMPTFVVDALKSWAFGLGNVGVEHRPATA